VTILASGQEILDLIPQRPPMVMIDTLYSVTDHNALSGLTILEENIFLKEGTLSSIYWGGSQDRIYWEY